MLTSLQILNQKILSEEVKCDCEALVKEWGMGHTPECSMMLALDSIKRNNCLVDADIESRRPIDEFNRRVMGGITGEQIK